MMRSWVWRGLLAAVLLLAGLYFWFIKPPAGKPGIVAVAAGSDLALIGAQLEEAGVVASATAFTFAARGQNLPPQPGRYVFLTGVYPWVAARMLARGVPEPVEITVTLPEGLRLEEIAARLEAAGACRGADFLRCARDSVFAAQLVGQPAPNLEGYLFPETYRFLPLTPAEDVVQRLFQAHSQAVADLSRPPNLDPHQFVTLASIVEREARLPEERPVIAAVFLNRLRRGMRLEADPTVRFALGRWDTTPVLYADLDNPSPYNTYRHAGLPPGPIASPGRASLEAVSRPAATNALFFVARGDGGHVFAATLAEHNRNVQAYRRRVSR